MLSPCWVLLFSSVLRLVVFVLYGFKKQRCFNKDSLCEVYQKLTDVIGMWTLSALGVFVYVAAIMHYHRMAV